MSFEKQIMSKDKYLNKFSRQMDAIVFIILHIIFATRAVGYSPVLAEWGIFSHVARAKIFDRL